MQITTAILLAFALGSVALFSILFVVILFSMRNHWDQIGGQKQSQDQPDA